MLGAKSQQAATLTHDLSQYEIAISMCIAHGSNRF